MIPFHVISKYSGFKSGTMLLEIPQILPLRFEGLRIICSREPLHLRTKKKRFDGRTEVMLCHSLDLVEKEVIQIRVAFVHLQLYCRLYDGLIPT